MDSAGDIARDWERMAMVMAEDWALYEASVRLEIVSRGKHGIR